VRIAKIFAKISYYVANAFVSFLRPSARNAVLVSNYTLRDTALLSTLLRVTDRFLTRDATPLWGVCPFVRPSVCLSRSCIRSKRINISSIFSLSRSHTILVFPHQTAWQYSDRDPLTGVINAGGVCKNRDYRRISGYLIDDWWSANNNCDRPPCSLPHRPPRISESLFITISMDDHDEEKTTEQNLFVRSSKSDAEVTNNRRLRSTYCTIEANYWQTRSIARPFCDSRATCQKLFHHETEQYTLVIKCSLKMPSDYNLNASLHCVACTYCMLYY